MASQVATQTQNGASDAPRPSAKRPNKSRGNNTRAANRNPRPAGNKKGKESGNTNEGAGEGKSPLVDEEGKDLAQKLDAVALDEDADEDLCWICAEPVKYYAISECNHRTCHVCAIRLRALYKKTECTFCKVCVSLILSINLRQQNSPPRSGWPLRNLKPTSYSRNRTKVCIRLLHLNRRHSKMQSCLYLSRHKR